MQGYVFLHGKTRTGEAWAVLGPLGLTVLGRGAILVPPALALYSYPRVAGRVQLSLCVLRWAMAHSARGIAVTLECCMSCLLEVRPLRLGISTMIATMGFPWGGGGLSWFTSTPALTGSASPARVLPWTSGSLRRAYVTRSRRYAAITWMLLQCMNAFMPISDLCHACARLN